MSMCPKHWPDECPNRTIWNTCEVLRKDLQRLDLELKGYWRMLEREQEQRINAA